MLWAAGIAGTNLALGSCYDFPCNESQGPSSQALLLSHRRGNDGLGALVGVCGGVPAGVIGLLLPWGGEEDSFRRPDVRREVSRRESSGFLPPPIFVLCPLSRRRRAWGGGKARLCWDCWIFTALRFSSTTGVFPGAFNFSLSWEPFGSQVGSLPKALPNMPGLLSPSAHALWRCAESTVPCCGDAHLRFWEAFPRILCCTRGFAGPARGVPAALPLWCPCVCEGEGVGDWEAPPHGQVSAALARLSRSTLCFLAALSNSASITAMKNCSSSS